MVCTIWGPEVHYPVNCRLETRIACVPYTIYIAEIATILIIHTRNCYNTNYCSKATKQLVKMHVCISMKIITNIKTVPRITIACVGDNYL